MDIKRSRSGFSSEEGQVLSWVLWIILVAVVVGFIITQCGPIIANAISTRGTANDAAEEAAITYASSHGNMAMVYEAVEELLAIREARLDGTISINYDQSGKASAVLVPVRKIVNTFLFENISYLAPYTETRAVGEHSIP